MKSLSDTLSEALRSGCMKSLSDVILEEYATELNESSSELSKAKAYVNKVWAGNDIIIKYLLSDSELENLGKYINNLCQKKRQTPPKVIRLTKTKIALVLDN